MFPISWMELLILTFATFRFTHLIVYDEITSWLRSPFLRVSYTQTETGQYVKEVEIFGSGIRYGIGVLLSCHWCVGFWSSTTILLLFWAFPASIWIWLVLAIAGASSLIEEVRSRS